jgi:ornithine carbamoyltransferase
MARSFLEAADIFGFHLALAAPPGYLPPLHERMAAEKRGSVSFHTSAREAAAGALIALCCLSWCPRTLPRSWNRNVKCSRLGNSQFSALQILQYPMPEQCQT